MDELEKHFTQCIQSIRNNDFKSATSHLYPVSKKVPRLANTSDDEKSAFVAHITSLLALISEKCPLINFESGDNARLLITDIFRILRSSCVNNPQVQEELGGVVYGERVMECTHLIVDTCKRLYRKEQQAQLMALCIQFLANLASGCHANQDLIWRHFRYDKLKSWLLSASTDDDEMDREVYGKVVNYACAVVDVCLPRQCCIKTDFLDDAVDRGIIVTVIGSTVEGNLERNALEKIAQIPNSLNRLMKDLSHRQRLSVLDAVDRVILECRKGDGKVPLPPLQSNLRFMVHMLISQPAFNAEQLSLCDACEMEDLHLCATVLFVLGSATTCVPFAADLSSFTVDVVPGEPKTLLMYALSLLRDVNEKGAESRNMLSMAGSPDDVDDTQPSYLLRRDLLRVLANLVYKNTDNQNQLRTLYAGVGFPLLFEHTKIDDRNPMASEWAKLALTNMLRDNEDNAHYVRCLKMEGAFDPTGVLHDCGLVLDTSGNKVSVKPNPRLPYTPTKMTDKETCVRVSH